MQTPIKGCDVGSNPTSPTFYGGVAEFEALGVEAPEWAVQNIASVRREVKSRNADRIAAKIRDTEARLDALKTPSQRKEDLKAELVRLQKLQKTA